MSNITLAEKIAAVERVLGWPDGPRIRPGHLRAALEAVLADLRARANDPPRKIVDRMTYRAGAEEMRERAKQFVAGLVGCEHIADAIGKLPVE